jgi:predicted dehydrogenase
LKPVKVGVIGVGHLGRFHALNYKQIEEAELVGVTDTNPTRASEIAQECQCTSFQNIESLLNEVEAVSIAVPTNHHFVTASQALSQNIHCLIEKPITETVAQADSLIRLVGVNRLILQVGHIERFNPALKALEGFSLSPSFIEAHRLAPFKPRGIEVSVILDLMIHDIDIVLSMIRAPVEKIDASGVAVVSDTIDIANARLRFADNSVANLTASRISQKVMRKMRLFQKNNYITIDFDRKETEIFKLDTVPDSNDQILTEIGVGDKKKRVHYQKPEVDDYNALQVELQTFIKTIRGEARGGVSGKAGRQALSIASEVLQQIDSEQRA